MNLDKYIKAFHTKKIKLCKLEGCAKRHHALGLCKVHYTREKRHGSK